MDVFVVFKQKTAYEMRISDWSSDVCSSDLFAYVNGRYVPHADAAVHVEDRGYQFADGVYEVVTIQGGRLVDEEGHMARLDRSLRELSIAWPMSRRALALVMRRLVTRNEVDRKSTRLNSSH